MSVIILFVLIYTAPCVKETSKVLLVCIMYCCVRSD